MKKNAYLIQLRKTTLIVSAWTTLLFQVTTSIAYISQSLALVKPLLEEFQTNLANSESCLGRLNALTVISLELGPLYNVSRNTTLSNWIKQPREWTNCGSECVFN